MIQNFKKKFTYFPLLIDLNTYGNGYGFTYPTIYIPKNISIGYQILNKM